jgi:hypothetical protein
MFLMLNVLFVRLKSVQLLPISILELELMTYTSVTLMAQYLKVRQRKLGTIIIQTASISFSMIVRPQGHCPRGIFAWPTQITSNKPSPEIVPLHFCTYQGGCF